MLSKREWPMLIKVGSVKLLPGYPAALDSREKIVIIADLHLGYEEAMASQGILLPKIQYKKAVQLIENLSRKTKAETLIINGDIKNSFDRLTPQERIEIIKFLSKAKELYSDVIIVRGNHDNYVSIIADRMDVKMTDSFVIDESTLVIHGHKIVEGIEKYKLIIIGHEHPSFNLRDSIGSIMKLPCFLRVPTTLGNEVLVLPPAGYYQAGNPVSLSREDYLSPIIREYGKIEDAIPIVIDVSSESLFEFPPLKIVFEALAENSITL